MKLIPSIISPEVHSIPVIFASKLRNKGCTQQPRSLIYFCSYVQAACCQSFSRHLSCLSRRLAFSEIFNKKSVQCHLRFIIWCKTLISISAFGIKTGFKGLQHWTWSFILNLMLDFTNGAPFLFTRIILQMKTECSKRTRNRTTTWSTPWKTAHTRYWLLAENCTLVTHMTRA